MEKLSFKSKRQEKDFDKMFNKIGFDVENCWTNSFGAIIVEMDWLEEQYFEELESIIKNEKNVTFNKNRKKLVID